jgi:hypothetical protein
MHAVTAPHPRPLLGLKQDALVWLADAARAGARIITGCAAEAVATKPVATQPACLPFGACARPAAGVDGEPPARRLQAFGVVASPAPPGFLPSSWQAAGGAAAAGEQQEQGAQGAAAPRVLFRAPLVVSCAGALHTPALLLRSGVKGRGNVGRHLRSAAQPA